MEVVYFPLFFLQDRRFAAYSFHFAPKCSCIKEQCSSAAETMLQGRLETRPYGSIEVTTPHA